MNVTQADDIEVGMAVMVRDNRPDESMFGGRLAWREGVPMLVVAVQHPFLLVRPATCDDSAVTLDTRRVTLVKVADEYLTAYREHHKCTGCSGRRKLWSRLFRRRTNTETPTPAHG